MPDTEPVPRKSPTGITSMMLMMTPFETVTWIVDIIVPANLTVSPKQSGEVVIVISVGTLSVRTKLPELPGFTCPFVSVRVKKRTENY